jgi:hypothetical protein
MNAQYGSIAAGSLAALLFGFGSATAQTSATDSPSTPGGSVTINPSVDPSTKTDVSPSPSVGTDTKSDSPSASPRGDDDRAKGDDHGDRQKMKDHEKIDKKGGLDRANDAAGDRG